MPSYARGRRAPKEDRGTFWSTLGAGITGAMEGHRADRRLDTQEQESTRRKEADTERAEIQRLNLELREMIARINEGGRMDRATMTETGRNDRWATPSGNVTTQQAGATERTAATIGSRERVNAADDATKRWQTEQTNMRFDKGLGFRFWDAEQDTETARRGQDITAGTATRGQDVSAGTQQRGQDLTFEAREADRLAREKIEAEKLRQNQSLFDPDGPDQAPPRPELPVMQTPAPEAPPVAPIVPRSPEAAQDQEAQDTQRLQAAIQRVQQATNPQDAAAAKAELTRLTAEIRARRQPRQ